MKPGETAYKDGVQCALFPLDILWCTQVPGPGEYSHCCGTATDWIGTTSYYPYYAPFDCSQIERGSDYAVYRSDNEVLTPSGKKRLTVIFMHDENIPTQTHFNQGDLIGRTGSAGYVTGDHVHLDQTINATWITEPSGIICGSGRQCYATVGGINVTEAFFITGEEQVITTLGLRFTKLEDYEPGGKLPAWLMAAAKKRKEKAYGKTYRKFL